MWSSGLGSDQPTLMSRTLTRADETTDTSNDWPSTSDSEAESSPGGQPTVFCLLKRQWTAHDGAWQWGFLVQPMRILQGPWKPVDTSALAPVRPETRFLQPWSQMHHVTGARSHFPRGLAGGQSALELGVLLGLGRRQEFKIKVGDGLGLPGWEAHKTPLAGSSPSFSRDEL